MTEAADVARRPAGEVSEKHGQPWHSFPVDDVLLRVKSGADGLHPDEAARRLSSHGANELPKAQQESVIVLFLRQFASILILTLFAAAGISAFMGEWVEAIAILVIVILAGIVGFIQEYQAERALEALQRLAAPNATVRRDGKDQLVPAREVVPGDVIVLKTGDAVPADSRIIDAPHLEVDESTLTGESLATRKSTLPLDGDNLPLGDRTNMVFSGTSVVQGRGTAVVIGTGGATEFGKIAALLQGTGQTRTPLQVVLDKLGRTLGIASFILAVAMSGLGLLQGYPVLQMFIWGVAIAVAVIPEALPAVVTITLALGVRRMATRNALIRKLPAVETLGATSIICSDKTGTLTQNEMTVRRLVCGGVTYEITGAGFEPRGSFLKGGKAIPPLPDPVIRQILVTGLLCNDALLQEPAPGHWVIIGDPTEGALVVAAAKAGLDHGVLTQEYQRIDEIPFTSERKCMTTVHTDGNGALVCTKGAPEVVLALCTHEHTAAGDVALNEARITLLLQQAKEMAQDALRVLALGYKRTGPREDLSGAERGLIFAGLVGIQDPPRPEVFDAIRTCRQAGIRPVMITGDHLVTALAVGKELGILREGAGALAGADLDRMSDDELAVAVKTTDIFARISPEHKLRIVNAFLSHGEVVAMTGDGVNDAPSLKRADIGVAMGITGTDVSKEASDMILTDDNFATIVDAVREGRSIFQNIRKYLVFLLSGNLGTVLALVIALLAGMPLPLAAVQVLFINFIMDGLIAIALGVEPPESGIMRHTPRRRSEGMLDTNALTMIGVIGLVIGLVPLGVYTLALDMQMSEIYAMTLFYWALIASRLVNGLNCRSLTDSVVRGRASRHPNPVLYASMAITVVLTGLTVYVPGLDAVFMTTALKPAHVGYILAASLLVLIVGETVKVIRKRAAGGGVPAPAGR